MKNCLILLGSIFLLVGCQTRSISDSDYPNRYRSQRSTNPLYRGELSELDILGAAPHQEATKTNIAKILKESSRPQLKQGDRLILIQSGATVPDNPMMEEVVKYFSVAPFSGVPPEEKAGLSQSLRLRAAQGGYRYIVCYWGVLESAQEDKEGKVISWVPIVGSFVPDQKQQMRIRLKALLVDVTNGGWKMLTPETYSDTGYNSRWSREDSDQTLVELLKQKGYKNLVADLLKK